MKYLFYHIRRTLGIMRSSVFFIFTIYHISLIIHLKFKRDDCCHQISDPFEIAISLHIGLFSNFMENTQGSSILGKKSTLVLMPQYLCLPAHWLFLVSSKMRSLLSEWILFARDNCST